MRILIVHNRYRIRAGEDRVFEQESQLLRDADYDVRTWTVDNQDISEGSLWDKISLGLNTIWSRWAYHEALKIIQDFHPDIVHVHNFLPLLSPSIFYACRKAGVPVVQTIHNYRLGCPAATFFREGAICELCLEKNLLQSLLYRCYRQSFIQTLTVAAMLQIHRWLGTWTRTVDAYIALTPFMRDKLIQMEIPAKKIYIKPNFIDDIPKIQHEAKFGEYYLFVGRLSPEKGIHILLEAYQKSNSSYPLVIIGSGELQATVEAAVKANPKIRYLGQQPKEQVKEYMQRAIALIFPSIWYEGFPLTILEAYSQSLPVVCSDIGSVSYAIEDGVTGFTYPAGNEEALKQVLASIEANPENWLGLKNKVLDSLDDIYFSKKNVHYLLRIYQELIDVNFKYF
ncbi:glycosyltransferase [Picosynechococcus sp. PCC 11901]|uniref:glycosyltransferase n=1 Tax=Picosynechococcus sp. PCC 11901 TaxID=2579791 RepID=UPI0010FBDD1E|nr:glycosyltransferase [Picosynechococcus sp. PCC 11901]QCS49041.1 glycosyltransferase [Picosynechococcus sp. PCC 11901]